MEMEELSEWSVSWNYCALLQEYFCTLWIDIMKIVSMKYQAWKGQAQHHCLKRTLLKHQYLGTLLKHQYLVNPKNADFFMYFDSLRLEIVSHNDGIGIGY